MADENISLAPVIENFTDDMYCWILDPASIPQTKRFFFPKIIQEQRMTYAINVGTANDVEIALKSPLTSYEEGVLVYFKAISTNTGAMTLKVDALLAIGLVDREGNPLAAGAVPVGSLNIAQFDGTNFQLLVSSGNGGGSPELPMLLASSTDDPTSGHVALQGVVVVNGTIAITDQNTLSLLWYIDYGSGYALANATGSLAGLKTDLESNMLLASDKANVRYVATEQVAYLGDMVNGFFVQLTS